MWFAHWSAGAAIKLNNNSVLRKHKGRCVHTSKHVKRAVIITIIMLVMICIIKQQSGRRHAMHVPQRATQAATTPCRCCVHRAATGT